MASTFTIVRDWLANESVAAFLGAFFAFLLVVLTDARRKRERLKVLRAQVKANGRVIPPMLEAIRNSFLSLPKGIIKPTGLRGFRVDDITRLKYEVIDSLKEKELLCLESVLHQMSGINDELAEETSMAKTMHERKYDDNAVQLFKTTSEALATKYKYLLAGLIRLQEVIEEFNKREYDKIEGAKYNIQDYLLKAKTALSINGKEG